MFRLAKLFSEILSIYIYVSTGVYKKVGGLVMMIIGDRQIDDNYT